MSNSSRAAGYLIPATTRGFPNGLTFIQFVQTLLVGLSELNGSFVRPEWQIAPPKAPDVTTNWLAFGIASITPNANASVDTDASGATTLSRHERVEIGCSFYGPSAIDTAGLVRDGFQIQQNLEALRAAKVGFTETSVMTHIPDLVNEQFRERVQMTITLQREILRSYPIFSLVSANGTIHTSLANRQYLLNWKI